jgi:HEAT repeat protein
MPSNIRLLSWEERTETMMSRCFFAALVMLLVVLTPTLGDDLFEPASEPPYFRPALMVPFYAEEKTDGPAIAGKPLRFWVERLLHEDETIRNLANETIRQEFHSEAIWDPGFFIDEEGIQFRDQFRKDYKSLVPLLLHVLKHAKDENIFGTVASMMAMFGPEAESILPDLRRLAIQPDLDGQQRMEVVFALLYVTPEDQAVGPIVLNYLKLIPKETLKELYAEQSANDMRASVGLSIPLFALMLNNSGHTKVEVPYLSEVALGDYAIPIRAMAIVALGQFEVDAKAAVPSLHKLLKDEDLFIRQCAAASLLDIEQDKALVPIIIEALGLEGKEREECEEGCKEFFADKEEERKSLAEIAEDDEFMLPLFIAMLKHESGFYRRQAIRNLGTVGRAAKPALPDLRKALKDSDEDTRKFAAEAIEKIERSVAKTSKN